MTQEAVYTSALVIRPIPLYGLFLFGGENERGVDYETKTYFYPVSIVVHGWIECMGIGAE